MKTMSLFGLLSLLAAPVLAQDPLPTEQRAVQSVQIVAAADEEGGAPRVQFYSTAVNGGDFVMASPMMGVSSDIFSLVNQSDVQKEIDLVGDQLKQLSDVQRDYSKRISERLKEFTSSGFRAEGGAKIKEVMDEMRKDQKSQMESILLPHQLSRLNQISLQVQMQQSGEAATLNSSAVADALGIDKEQQEKLKKRADQIKAELERKIERLKQQAKEELLSELTRDQRKKLDEMTGDRFEIKQPNWGQRLQRLRGRESRQQTDDGK